MNMGHYSLLMICIFQKIGISKINKTLALVYVRGDPKDEPKKKGPLGKLKEKIDDSEEQMAILSTFVRLGILVWSGDIYARIHQTTRCS